MEVWPETPGITPQVNDRTIRVAMEEAESKLPSLTTVDDVLAAVALVYGFEVDELSTPSRRRDLSEARAVAAYFVREIPFITMVRLSEELHRHVSNFSHIVGRMEERLTYDSRLAGRLEAVRRLLA